MVSILNPVGTGAGGSTTVNGMIRNRGGWAADYDAWEAAGITSWNWPRFLRAFQALERHDLDASEFRGGDGLQSIGVAGRDPARELWIETLRGGLTVELEQDRGTRPRGHRAGGRRD
jgi:hypothetical protein